MIYLTDIEGHCTIPANSVHSDCAYIRLSWARNDYGSHVVYDVDSGPDIHKLNGEWKPIGLFEYMRNLMFQRGWTTLKLVMCVYRMYDAEGNSLGADYFGDSDHHIEIFYIDHPVIISGNLSAGDFIEQRMLFSGKVAWVTPGLRLNLNYAGVYGVSGNTVTYTYKDGSEEQVTSPGELTFNADVSRAHVQLRNRSIDVFYLDVAATVFQFRNVFNKDEDLAIPGVIVDSPATEHQIGYLGSTKVKYDVKQDREFTFKSALLPPYMYDPIIALCRSRLVRLGRWSNEIVITEYKMPKSSAPNSPIRFEMKYKYADTTKNDLVAIT